MLKWMFSSNNSNRSVQRLATSPQCIDQHLPSGVVLRVKQRKRLQFVSPDLPIHPSPADVNGKFNT